MAEEIIGEPICPDCHRLIRAHEGVIWINKGSIAAYQIHRACHEHRSRNADAAIKDDDEKRERPELLSFIWVEGVSAVLAYGAKKYAADNWRKGMKRRRLIGAALRHLFRYARGESHDGESGLHHLLHASCCLMFLYESEVCEYGTDDRFKEIPK